uniref:ATP-binding response regulator n=1 Tax=Halomonas sp. TaxID=1486246 RepID=UPI0026185A8A|nr:hybrid sensor histidine kinase/response regulator [Halomonas sp.]
MDLLSDVADGEPKTPLEQQLFEENRRLRRICQALMERVESAGTGRAPYGAFEHAVLLAEQVRERTDTLHRTLDELAETNTRLEDARREAEAANHSKTRFLAAVSHDLLQPLNAARLFTSALEELSLDRNAGTLVTNIGRSLRDVEQLLGTLVDISRLDAGVLTPDVAPFAVTELLDALAEESRQMAQAKGLAFSYVASSAVVESDLALLARVIRNLVSNAVRYTSTGRVLLGCRRRAEGLEIVVADTGPGIPESRREEVFLEFRRGRDQVSRQSPGLGLGLAIVDRIARLLDHPLRLASQPGQGTLFALMLPYARVSPAMEPTLPSAVPWRGSEYLSGAHLWVLDNDARILDGMKALLGGWGCHVHVSTCVAELEEQLAEADRACRGILLVDYHLDAEDGDGLSLAERLIQHYPWLMPMLITANRDAAIKRRCRERGFPCVRKPVKPLRLRQALVHLLEGARNECS